MAKKDVPVTQASMSSSDARDQLPTSVKLVASVALADATEKQKPSPWTKNMFLVSVAATSIGAGEGQLH